MDNPVVFKHPSSLKDVLKDKSLSRQEKGYIVKILKQITEVIPPYVDPSFGKIGGLFLSDYDSSLDIDRLRSMSIKTIICIGNYPRPNFSGINTFTIKCDDNEDADIYKYFAYVNDIIRDSRSVGHNVLVHCFMGISRSSTLCLAYLISNKKTSLDDAFSYLKERRPIINPNPGFERQLRYYEEELMKF